MAKWSFEVATWTPVAVADTANFTINGYMAMQGVSTTQRFDITEVYMGGQATSSAPTYMILARDSTVGATVSTSAGIGFSNGSLDPASYPQASSVCFTSSTTIPQRSATLGKLNLTLNAFGGIVRWVAPPGGEFKMLGLAASFGETSLSAFTGGTPGALGSHIIYETFLLPILGTATALLTLIFSSDLVGLSALIA